MNCPYFETFPWAVLTGERYVKFRCHPYGEERLFIEHIPRARCCAMPSFLIMDS